MLSSGLPAAQLKSDLFKSLGHPLRVQVLEQLVAGERSVGSLAEAIGCELSNLSQQLGVLRRAGVVTTRREVNTIFYTVRGSDVEDLLAAAKRMVMSMPQRVARPAPPPRAGVAPWGSLQVVAGVGLVEALVGQRKVGHDRLGQGDRK